jgi:hypothetical protein
MSSRALERTICAFDPIETDNMLAIAKAAKIPANYVFDFLVEFGKYFR